MNLFHRRPLCVASSFFLIGMLLAVPLPVLPRQLLLVSLPLLLFFLRLLPRYSRRTVALTLVFLTLGTATALVGIDLPVSRVGRLSGGSAVYTATVSEQLDADRGLYGVSSVECDGRRIFCRLALTSAGDRSLAVGDRIACSGTVRPLTEWDSRTLRSGGYSGILNTGNPPIVVGHRESLRSRIARLSDILDARLAASADGREGALMRALLLGETDALSPSTETAFRRLGISHMLAISGMHLVTLSAALAFLLRLLRVPRGAVAALTVVFVFLYSAVTGFSPSVLRAAVMATVFQSAFFFRRRSDALTALFFSGLLLLLLFPHMVYSLSFWLSFSATLGILLSFSAGLYTRFPVPRSVRSILLTPVFMTVSSSLFTLPILCLFFGEFSLLALPANLLFALPMEALLCLSFLALTVGPLPPVTFLCRITSGAVLSLSDRLSSARYAVLSFRHPALLAVSCLCVAAVVLLLLLPRFRRRVAVAAAAGCCSLLLISVLLFALPRGAGASLVCFSDGEGEQLLLSEGTRRFLIDCSDGSAADLAPPLNRMTSDRICELDGYLMTHYHGGQLASLPALIRRTHLRRVYLPEPSSPSEVSLLGELTRILDAEGIPSSVYRNGDDTGFGGFSVSASCGQYADASGHPVFTVSVRRGNENLGYVSAGALSQILNDGAFPSETVTAVMLGTHGDAPFVPLTVSFPPSLRTLLVGDGFYTSCRFRFDGDPTVLFSPREYVHSYGN